MEANSTTNLDTRAFVHVVERQSFAAAAKALDLTPSAVSKLVSPGPRAAWVYVSCTGRLVDWP